MNLSWSLKAVDQFPKKADTLVGWAHDIGGGSYALLPTDLSVTNVFTREQWVRVVTIAGVFIAVTRLESLDLENCKKQKILEVVKQRLMAWNSDWQAGFENCKAFVETTHDRLAMTYKYKNKRFLASDCLGSWMAWNLLGHSPESPHQKKLIRMSGSFIVNVFFDWWEQT